MKCAFSLHIFERILNIEFNNIPYSDRRVVLLGQTDRQEKLSGSKKLIAVFFSKYRAEVHCLQEGTEAFPICPSGKSNTRKKMGVGHWWNDTEREKGRAARKTWCSAIPTMENFKWTSLGSKPGIRGERPEQ